MITNALDYTKVINEDLKSIPENYLPIIANIVHSFKESVTYHQPLSEETKAALDEGLAQAERGEFATGKEVANLFAQCGVDVTK